jgi:hypothetical protein
MTRMRRFRTFPRSPRSGELRLKLVPQRNVRTFDRFITRREQSPQLAEPFFDRVVTRQAGGALQLDDERVERAVLMVGRAEIVQPRVRLALATKSL